tara:strand:+ start:2782 stop:3060 length:279 start_codon:yes stop_codon:yes gene_type:complete
MEDIKAELGEELEYDENNLIHKVDDSWIAVEDREKLLICIKEMIKLEHPWAFNEILECIVLKKYYNVVEKMDEEQYRKDKKDPVISILSVLS